MKILKLGSSALLWILTVLYPFIIYMALKSNTPEYAFAALGIILLLKIISGQAGDRLSSITVTVLGITVLILFKLRGDPVYLMFYPSFVAYGFLAVFVFSLTGSRSAVERIASLSVKKEEITDDFKRYCRRVTQAWCVFMFLNGTCALFLALFAHRDIWVIYTGFISYILMGLMFLGEYIIRIHVRKGGNR
jgi:uncharacterized membrane protein